MNTFGKTGAVSLALTLCSITAVTGCKRNEAQPAPSQRQPQQPADPNAGVNTVLGVIGTLQRMEAASAVAADGTTNATNRRGSIGQRFTYNCPAGFVSGSVWGNGTYTDDSSVCNAAVHAGIIAQATGGLVTIEIRPGQDGYTGSIANGVSTSSFGQFGGSFTFVNNAATTVDWTTSATANRGSIGRRVTINCPPNGTTASVWGSGAFTDDSSVCNAAVHAGKITREAGGTVTYEIRPGQPSYMGSTSNGVTSSNYGEYPGSFVFP
jgi:hypothetical protein